jgi:hypothetical protein
VIVAIVRDLRLHRTYLASEVDMRGRAVTFVGSLLHRDLCGERTYPAQTRTLPLSRVEIEWTSDERRDR